MHQPVETSVYLLTVFKQVSILHASVSNLICFFSLVVKAGGMRVARTRQSSTGEGKEKTEMTKEEIEEYGSRLMLRWFFLIKKFLRNK